MRTASDKSVTFPLQCRSCHPKANPNLQASHQGRHFCKIHLGRLEFKTVVNAMWTTLFKIFGVQMAFESEFIGEGAPNHRSSQKCWRWSLLTTFHIGNISSRWQESRKITWILKKGKPNYAPLGQPWTGYTERSESNENVPRVLLVHERTKL
jgi:hypothetical protein